MELIQWSEKLSVGIPEIDDQHKKLVSLLNRLHEANADNRGTDVIWDTLVELVDYVRVHFAAEEKVMRDGNFPKLKDHMLLHYDLMKQVLEMNSTFWNSDRKFNEEVLNFLKRWLLDHIMAEDMQFAFYFKTKK